MIKIFRFAYIAIVSFMFVSCGESIEDKMNKKLSEMSELSELGTVEYTISKIIKANDNELDYLYEHVKHKYPRDKKYFEDILSFFKKIKEAFKNMIPIYEFLVFAEEEARKA
mgnify:CR=1 FL=1